MPINRLDHDLFGAWRKFDCGRPPHLLPEDAPYIRADRHQAFASWGEFSGNRELGDPDNSRLQLGLIPQPYVGDLARARVFLLLLNPGAEPADHFAEYEVPAFRERKLRNLEQARIRGDEAFYILDPKFSWHPGFRWWDRKCAGLIDARIKAGAQDRAAARREIAGELAAIQLFPYHSRTFSARDGLKPNLPSAKLAIRFLRDVLLPEARRGEVLLIALRQASAWGLREERNVLIYASHEARGAHLGPKSRGGRKIIEFLARAPRR